MADDFELDMAQLPPECEQYARWDQESATLRIAEGFRTEPKLESFIHFVRELGIELDILEVPMREIQRESSPERQTTTNTIVEAKRLFNEANRLGSSDIHLETNEGQGFISMRINGRITPIRTMRGEDLALLIATIYTIADVSDKSYQPVVRQDAQVTDPGKLPKGVASIRVNTGPCMGGQYMVLRMLYEGTRKIGVPLEERLKGLGWPARLSADVRKAVTRPSGLFLMSGPTGSGKSTTLMNIMEAMVDEAPHKQYYSLEDPTEYPMLGVRQINVGAGGAASGKERAEIYARALMSILRADPDVVMVGEIREREILRLALEASMTGHFVPSTLHTNSAWATLQRLAMMLESPEMPSPWPILGDPAVRLTMFAQRLVPTICPECKKVPERDMLPGKVWDKLNEINATPYIAGDGCEKCGEKKGVIGRTTLLEGVVPTNKMYGLISQGKVAEAKQLWIDQGGVTMQGHALELIAAGHVDAQSTWACADLEADD